uniref:Mitochondrial carrier protein n=1 Tax=Amphora coffeiformis TaxID=265554 RepID=A0A7S3L8P2_9STRA
MMASTRRIDVWRLILCLCFLLFHAAVSAAVTAAARADRRRTAAAVLTATTTTTLLAVSAGNEPDSDTHSPLPWNGIARGGAEGSISAWIDGVKSGLASALAAACVKTLLQPIDAIKTMQQYYQSTGQALSVVGACREIWNLGGFGKFYAGLGVTVIGAMPGVSLYFGVYQYCKKKLRATPWGERNPLVAVAVSAAIGNSVASFSRVPYEVLKQKLQMGVYDTTWEALVAAAKNPVAMLFPKGGVAIQMIRDVPYAIATLLVYEMLQGAFTGVAKERDFLLGGLAGGFGSWVTNPMDVIKTRLQTNSDLYEGSVVVCAKAVWGEGGAAAFLRGAVPRLAHKIPANAFFFLFYETFRRILGVEEAVEKQAQTKKQ